MKHLIVLDGADRGAWGFQPEDTGSVICESGEVRQTPISKAELAAGVHTIVCPPNSPVHQASYWSSPMPDNVRVWFHVGGNETIHKTRGEILAKWKEQCPESPLPDTDILPYSLRTRSTDWDLIIQDLAQELQGNKESSEISKILRRLDESAIKAFARYYAFQEIEKLLEAVFPVYLDLATLAGPKLADQTVHEQCTSRVNGLSDEIKEMFQEAPRKTQWIETVYRKVVPLLTKTPDLDEYGESKVRESLELLKKLGQHPSTAIDDAGTYTCGLKPLFQVLNLRP